MDIDSVPALRAALDGGASLAHLRLQGLDLRGHDHIFDGRTDIEGLVVLGGRIRPKLVRRLTRAGAIVFPPTPHVPVDPYRSNLYAPDELYEGLADHGYAATPDAPGVRVEPRPGTDERRVRLGAARHARRGDG